MKLANCPRQQGIRFNITPLIDIVFLLVIFFLVATHFVRTERVEAVELPNANEPAKQDAELPGRLVITVTADRTYHVSGSPVLLAKVEQLVSRESKKHREANERFEVQLRADKTVPYELVKPIIRACAAAGKARFSFAVLPD